MIITILLISVAGMLFSGYLSLAEISGTALTCPLASAKILRLPICVYGFFMYLAIFILSIVALKIKKKK